MQEFVDSLRRLIALNVEYARFRVAEKLADALSEAAVYCVLVVIGFMTLLVASMGLGFLLAEVMPAWAAFFCVALAYMVGAVPLLIFRGRLFVDGISRAISRLLLNPPSEDENA